MLREREKLLHPFRVHRVDWGGCDIPGFHPGLRCCRPTACKRRHDPIGVEQLSALGHKFTNVFCGSAAGFVPLRSRDRDFAAPREPCPPRCERIGRANLLVSRRFRILITDYRSPVTGAWQFRRGVRPPLRGGRSRCFVRPCVTPMKQTDMSLSLSSSSSSSCSNGRESRTKDEDDGSA